MAVTFLLKERNVFGGPAKAGAKPQALGQVVRSCPALTISPRDSSTRHWGAGSLPDTSSLGGVTHCTHIPMSALHLSVPHCSTARHEWGPLSWLCSFPEPVGEKLPGGSCWVNPSGWAAFSGDLKVQKVVFSF